MSDLFVGIVAGLVSAALTLLLGGTSPFAVIPLCLSLLPILVATLGWRHQTGLAAAMAGAIVCTIGGLVTALVYLTCIGLPAWGLAYLFLLGRRTDEGLEWYPLGHLMLWIVGLAVMQQIIPVLVASGGSFEGYLADFKMRFEPLLQMWGPQLEEAFAGSPVAGNSGAIVAILVPTFIAPVALGLTLATVWGAARTTVRAGRLPRPLPRIPEMRIPFWILIVLAGSFAANSLLDDLAGIAARTLLAMSLTAVGIQGLASLHYISHAWPQRPLVLWVAYLAFVFLPIGNLLIALFGAIDILFNIRNRAGANGSPPNDNAN